MDQLVYVDGSPFARFLRILNREWTLGLDEREIKEFPLPPEVLELNPLGQVPVLVRDGKDSVFPTFQIFETLRAHAPSGAYDPLREQQSLLVALALGDALVAARYQEWAGLGSVSENRLGFDPKDRNLTRVHASLSWLATRLSDPQSVPAFAVSVFLLWAESRGRLDKPAPPKLTSFAAENAMRPSFQATAPETWNG